MRLSRCRTSADARFVAKGSLRFRRWLFCSIDGRQRLDFLVEQRRWVFDTHAQYTSRASRCSRAARARRTISLEVAGVAASRLGVRTQTSRQVGICRSARTGARADLGGAAASLASRSRSARASSDIGRRVSARARGAGSAFRLSELQRDGRPTVCGRTTTKGLRLWKGESFDQYRPDMAPSERWCPTDRGAVRESAQAEP